jgi:hypothetical protein
VKQLAADRVEGTLLSFGLAVAGRSERNAAECLELSVPQAPMRLARFALRLGDVRLRR